MAEIRLKEVLAFVNHKGGVGKTTSVQSLATGLRRYGKGFFGKGEDGKERKPRVLLIDHFNSIKVRLEQYFSKETVEENGNFNSIKVRLELRN